MTLKLVPPDNIAELPVYNFKDIAGCARKFADQLEAGKHGEPTRAVMVLDTPDGVTVEYWGATANGLEILGVLEVAKFRIYEANEDD